MSNRVNTIAKNTIFLFFRTILLMIISIYSSRVLLDKLGVDDFGIYNLVGGVVAMFASLRGVFSQSVQRFLNYEKGLGDESKVNKVFNISLIVHLLLAFVFFVIVGIFGCYFISNTLVLPDGKLQSSLVVFVSSLIASVISIITIPYDSVIVANEKFDFYAWTSIFEAIAKLAVIYLITIIEYDSLISYSILITIVTIFIRVLYIIYSKRFKECKIILQWDKKVFADLASFSGWNFLGNTSYALTNEGVNFVINTFAGVSANAARGIAYQVKNVVQQLSANLVIASRPFIIESAAQESKSNLFTYTIKLSRLMYLALLLVAMPLIVYTEYILDLWLIEIPEGTVLFVRLVMVHLIIRAPQSAIDLLFASLDKMKKYQIVQSISLFMSLPLSYVLLKIGLPVYWAFISMCIVEAITLFAIVNCAKVEVGFNVYEYWNQFLKMELISIPIFTILGFIVYKTLIPFNLLTFALFFSLLVILEVMLTYILFLSLDEKNYVKSIINKKLNQYKL